MKEKNRKELITVYSHTKTELNASNRITVINTIAVPEIGYSFNIINLELQRNYET